MFKKLIKSIDNLADAIDSLVEKLDTVIRVVNTVGTSVHVERIAGSDPAVQKALGIQEAEPGKPMNTRRRRTRSGAQEDRLQAQMDLQGGQHRHHRIFEGIGARGHQRDPEAAGL